MQQITIRRPDDWDVHLRYGAMLIAVAPETARHFGRAIIMPNLVPPVVTGAHAAAYRDRILAALPEGAEFEPLMTLLCRNVAARQRAPPFRQRLQNLRQRAADGDFTLPPEA
jgi:dihydroorotase